MASRLTSQAILNGQRGLATQAATAKKSAAGSKAQASQLASGVSVASLDSGNAISSVAVLVKTGSRHENYDNLGVNQVIRLAAGFDNTKNSGFANQMNLQQMGCKVDVIGSREYTLYTAQAPRNNIGSALGYLTGIIDSPSFKPWNLKDQIYARQVAEIAGLTLPAVANELLHQAAFRTGLGNSLYSSEAMLGQHKPAMLQDFHNKNYVADRVVVLGLDLDHDLAVQAGEQLGLAKGTGGGPAASKFYPGQDMRQAGTGATAVLAVGTSAASAANIKEAMATRLLQYVLGLGPKIKRGTASGQLSKAVAKINGVSVSALNYSYSDAGLLGAMIVSDANVAGQALDAVVAALRSTNVTEAELAAAKKAMTIDLEDQTSNVTAAIESMAVNMSLGAKEAMTPAQMAGMFNNVSLADVQAAAKKLASAKFSMGAAGNLGNVPYIDQL